MPYSVVRILCIVKYVCSPVCLMFFFSSSRFQYTLPDDRCIREILYLFIWILCASNVRLQYISSSSRNSYHTTPFVCRFGHWWQINRMMENERFILAKHLWSTHAQTYIQLDLLASNGEMFKLSSHKIRFVELLAEWNKSIGSKRRKRWWWM